MSVRRDGDIIRLEGECHVNDAEALTALLDGDLAAATVDLSQCRRLHGAVLQALVQRGHRRDGVEGGGHFIIPFRLRVANMNRYDPTKTTAPRANAMAEP